MKGLMETVAKQQEEIAGLVEAIKAMPRNNQQVDVNVQQAPRRAEDIRAEKVQQLSLNLRKSNRIKLYKADTDINVYLRKFGEEIKSLKQMVGIADNLTRDEYVPIFRTSLDFHVLERVEQVFKKNPANVFTWVNISIDNLHKLMKQEFGPKNTDVADVLKQFGASRLTKSADKTCQEFYFEWLQSIPEIMKPTSEAEKTAFVDLIHRSMYYIALDDSYLQKALSDLKKEDPKLKDFFDETVAAESRRRCYDDIKQLSNNLDKGGSPFQNGTQLSRNQTLSLIV